MKTLKEFHEGLNVAVVYANSPMRHALDGVLNFSLTYPSPEIELELSESIGYTEHNGENALVISSAITERVDGEDRIVFVSTCRLAEELIMKLDRPYLALSGAVAENQINLIRGLVRLGALRQRDHRDDPPDGYMLTSPVSIPVSS